MVKSEYEVENGYIDITLLRREPMILPILQYLKLSLLKSEYEAYGEKIVGEKKTKP